MSPRLRPAAWLAASLAVCLAAGCSHGRLKLAKGEEGEVIESEGWAPLDAQDLIGTKQRSLTDAEKKAVERVVGVFISAKTRVDQAINVDSRILANVKGYIRKYDVLSERQEGGFYKTRIKAVVLYQKVGDDLKEMGLVRPPPPPGNPKVVVQVKARSRGNAGDSAGLGVQRALVDKGFTVADQADHADLVVSGDADAYPIEDARLAGFRSFRARVTVKAAKANGQVLAQKSEEASGLDPAESVAEAKAFDAAGALAGEALANELSSLLKGQASIVVRVLGMDGLDRVQKFVDDLRNNPGVTQVTLASYAGGRTELQVVTEDVAGEELAGIVLRMKKYDLTARSVTPYEVEVAAAGSPGGKRP